MSVELRFLTRAKLRQSIAHGGRLGARYAVEGAMRAYGVYNEKSDTHHLEPRLRHVRFEPGQHLIDMQEEAHLGVERVHVLLGLHVRPTEVRGHDVQMQVPAEPRRR